MINSSEKLNTLNTVMDNNLIEEKKFISIQSNLENAEGKHEIIKIKLGEDGKPRALVFEDIDKTLLHLEPTYKEIRKKMWPEAVARDGLEEFSKVHLDGFRLGTMWRELYRIYGIYSLGKEEWKDANIYQKDFLAKGKEGEHIDKPGDEYHEFSNGLLEKFDEIASKTVEEQAKENPHFFDDAKIGPMYKFNTILKRLQIPIVGMTANPRKFAEALCKYSGLAEVFIVCATDTDVPGTKEYKVKWSIEDLEKKGLPIPYSALMGVGDSDKDAGSVSRYKELVKNEHPDVDGSGVIVIANDEELEDAVEKLKGIKNIKIHSFNYNKVPVDKNGDAEFFSKDRGQYYQEL
jgi:phosphoglycolate phosphatase-like HAD superfamily hydrolase